MAESNAAMQHENFWELETLDFIGSGLQTENIERIKITLMPSDVAQSFKTSGSTQTTATKLEFKLSPVTLRQSAKEMVGSSMQKHEEIFLPYTKHCATNLHLAYTFSIFSGAMYSPWANLKMFFFLLTVRKSTFKPL